jgi:hypothetical protein
VQSGTRSELLRLAATNATRWRSRYAALRAVFALRRA